MTKKLFLLLLMCIFTISVFAQFGSLTVSSNSNQKFWLFIDDVLQNEYATHAIKISGMQYNYYKIRVEMDNRDNNSVGQNVLITNNPNGNNYVISADRGNNLIFGKAKMPANPFFIQSILLPNTTYYSYYQQYLYPGFNTNVNYGHGNQYKGNQYQGYQQYYQGSGHGGNQGYPPQGPGYPPSGHNNPGHGGNTGPGVPPPPSQGICMPSLDFNRAISVIQNESFENSKLSTAKQVTSNNTLCVSQIVQICRTFSYEQSKLDYAKFAYRYCADPNNYFLLNDVFSYSSSKDELRRFIDGR